MPLQNALFVLGPIDPEMQEIEALLKRARMRFTYANHNGKRAQPDTAYTADMLTVPPNIQQVVLVECKPRLSKAVEVIVVDHHKPGDPGYDKRPSQFWEGSSLGQVFTLLKTHQQLPSISRSDMRRLKVIAASDHCLAAARRGECPGVRRQDVIAYQLLSIAAGTGYSELEVRAAMTMAGNRIDSAPRIKIGRYDVRDLGYVEQGYSLAYLAIREMAAQRAVPCLVRQRCNAKETKVMLWAPSNVLKHFPAWARKQGAHTTFGVSNRGYAGAVFPN